MPTTLKAPLSLLVRASLFALCLVAVLLSSHDGSAGVEVPGKAACCMGPVSFADSVINPATGGDKDFFETPSGPPSAAFLLSNNAEMQDFAVALPQGATGCSDTAVDAFYDKSDAAKSGATTFDDDADFSGGKFFDPTMWFVTTSTRLPMQSGSGASVTGTLASDFKSTRGYASTRGGDACGEWPWTADEDSACTSCLSSKGWYRGSNDRWVVSGGFLNTHPPKFVIARKVLKDIVMTVDNLRMGVFVFDGDPANAYDPAQEVHPVKPNCNLAYPIIDESDLKRNDIVNKINGITFTVGERSIGEALFSIGGYFSSQKADSKWENWFKNLGEVPAGYPGNATWPGGDSTVANAFWSPASGGKAPWESGGEQKSFCWTCQAAATIVIADGTPKADNSVPVSKMLQLLVAAGAKHPDGTPVTFAPGTADPGGINYCDEFGVTKESCDDGDGIRGPDAKNRNFMDDVAFFISHMDLRDDLGGNQGLDAGQRVRVYTIGYGDNSPMLRSIAMAGRGKFFRADSPQQLKDSIMGAINDLKETSTSFASANISTVQVGGSAGSMYIPRFIPHNTQPYEGHLYRFRYFSEFVEGCDATKAKSDEGDPADLNDDKDCDDVFVLDKPASFTLVEGAVPAVGDFSSSNIIQENKEGNWVKVNTATVDADGKLVGGTPAVPFWDASTVLGSRSASARCAAGGRCIFTVIDRDGNGVLEPVNDNPPIEFISGGDEEALLRPYILSAGNGFCADLFSRLSLVWSDTAENNDKCARLVIDHTRGIDVFDFDGDGNTTEDRPCAGAPTRSCKLGDIFHSSPIGVDPPVDPFLCDLALHSQCVRTLYADFNADGRPPVSEPVCTATSGKPCYKATPMDPAPNYGNGTYGAYSSFVTANKSRDKFLLVGANDGMLHAFHVGKLIANKAKVTPFDDVYDMGTGTEMWAFVPPDLMPKLGRAVNAHEYFVDGTPMVRDVWVDGSGASASQDGIKQADEFHTVAVLSERGGGQRYFGLDVTDPMEMTKSTSKAFRWMYPNACDKESFTFGESWMNYAPKPPSIGPVRIENTARARGWDERWVTFVNGGYSSDLGRGRGTYMLDVWTGKKLWSFAADLKAGGWSNDYKDLVENMIMPVAAAPAMLDIGKGETPTPDQDGFFDTAVVGDLGGQVWMFRFNTPGKIGDSGVVENWYGARAFEVDRQDAKYTEDRSIKMKTPFFNIPSNTFQSETGWLRTFLGTGDRQNLRDSETLACGPDNLLACARMGCSVHTKLTSNVNNLSVVTDIEFANFNIKTNTTTSNAGEMNANCSKAETKLDPVSISCSGSYIGKNYTWSNKAETSCQKTSNTWNCTVSKFDAKAKGDLQPTADATAGLPRNRYYGFQSYGGGNDKAKRVFNTEAEALTFDKLRLTDKTWTRDDKCGSSGCTLKDVSIPSSAFVTFTDINGRTQRYIPSTYAFPRAGSMDPGWFIQYESLDEKTAAGSSILAGVVFWPTFLPPSGTGQACANPLGGDSGRSWQADVISGAPDMAESFRYTDAEGKFKGYLQARTRSVSAPPPEPANVISISKTGQVRYGMAVLDPGAAPVEETIKTNKDPASDLYWLEVPRSLHLCRHVDKRACK